MGTARDAAKLFRDEFFSKDMTFYTRGRAWNMEDLWQLMRYDLLEACVLLYVIADEEDRKEMAEGAGEILKLSDPENAIRYMLYYHIFDQQKAVSVLHTASRCSSVLLTAEQEKKKKLDEDSLTSMLHYIKELLLLGITTADDHYGLGGITITLRALMACQRNNLLAAGLTGVKELPVEWYTYDEMMDLYRKKKMRQDPYVRTGDLDLDRKGEMVFGVLKGQVEGLFRYQIEASEEPGYYSPARDVELSRACREMLSIEELIRKTKGWRKQGKLEQTGGLDQAVKELYAVAEDVDHFVKLRNRSSIELKDVFRVELLDFLLYLAESDQYIARNEAEAINRCCEVDLGRSEMRKRIREENLYTVTFERKTPLGLDLLCQADRQLAEQLESSPSYAERYLSLLEEIGRLFLLCDGSANEDEKRDLKTYIGNLRQYAAKNGSSDQKADE